MITRRVFYFFDSHEKCESMYMISVRPAGWLSICGKNVNFAILLDTINILNFKLYMMVVLTDFYPWLPDYHFQRPLLLQGHIDVKQFLLKMLCSYPIQLKLCTVVDYIAWGLCFHWRFDDLDFISMLQVCLKYKMQIVLFRFLFRFLCTVVWMLYGCYIH